MSDKESPDLPNVEAFKLWTKYEDVAMHFNDLLMKWRLHAIGGLAALVTLTGSVIKEIRVAEIRYSGLLLLTGTLFFAWTALACLDLFYYRKLLRGAVEELLRVEQDFHFKLSTTIEKHARKGGARGPWVFYVLGFVPLILIMAYAGFRLAYPPQLTPNPSQSDQSAGISTANSVGPSNKSLQTDGASPRR